MKPKEFVQALDQGQITAAIAAAERSTSGEIRVFVTHRAADDPVTAAQEQFAKLGMTKTTARNGVLIFLAPESRKFAVVGDEGIHAHCGGDTFWQAIVGETMRPRLQEGRYTDAIVAAVSEVGRVLAKHFPPTGEGVNELPDDVIEDKDEG